MTNVEHNEKTRVGILLALVVAVFSVVGWQIWSMLSGQGPARVSASTPGTAGEAMTAEAPVVTLPLIDVPAMLASTASDPFRKVLKEVVPAPVVTKSAGWQGTPWKNGFSNPLPPLPPVGGSSFAIVPTGSEVHLNGIVKGETALAVFAVGERTVFAREGEKLSEGMTLIQIGESGVWLRRGKTSVFVRVGE